MQNITVDYTSTSSQHHSTKVGTTVASMATGRTVGVRTEKDTEKLAAELSAGKIPTPVPCPIHGEAGPPPPSWPDKSMHLLMPDCLAHLAYGDGGCDDRRRPLARCVGALAPPHVRTLHALVFRSVVTYMTENRNKQSPASKLIFFAHSKFAREAGSGRRTRYLTALLSSTSTCRHT